jgi:hypothetical protein
MSNSQRHSDARLCRGQHQCSIDNLPGDWRAILGTARSSAAKPHWRQAPINAVVFFLVAMCFALTETPALAQVTFPVGSNGLPHWVKEVGARQAPKGGPLFLANAYGAVGNGIKNSTAAIQKAIDACAKAGGGVVSFETGSYVTGALFLKSNVNLLIDKNVTLLPVH